MKVTRIKEMIGYNLLIIRQILLFSTLEMNKEQCGE